MRVAWVVLINKNLINKFLAKKLLDVFSEGPRAVLGKGRFKSAITCTEERHAILSGGSI